MLLCYLHLQPKRHKETPLDSKRNKSVALETRNVQMKEPSGNEMADHIVNGYTLVITPQVDSHNPCLLMRHEIDLEWSLFFFQKRIWFTCKLGHDCNGERNPRKDIS